MALPLSSRLDDASQRTERSATSEAALEFGWQQAARILLNAAGYLDSIETADSLRSLRKILRGTGFDLVETPLVNHTLPEGDCQLGHLLQLENGRWHAILGTHDDARLLNDSGKEATLLTPQTLENCITAWALTERVIDLQSVRPFLQRYRSYFIDLLVAALVVNLFALVLPLFSSFVYDKILGNGILETMWALVIGIIIVAGIEFCVRIVRIHIAERFSVGSEVEIDHATFRNLLDTSANHMPPLGRLLERYKQILSHRDFLSSSCILALADVPFLLLFMVTIAIVSGPLVFVSLINGALMLGISIVCSPAILEYEKKSHLASERRYGLLTDLLSSREAVIGGAFRQKLTERWRQASVTAVQASSKARYWRGLSGSLVNAVATFSFISVLIGGVYMVENHELTAGGLLAASMLTSRTVGVFGSILTLLLSYKKFRIALSDLNQITPTTTHAMSTQNHGQLNGSVQFDNVTCSLRQGERPVLKNISLSIPAGEIVGIAGAPGAGKTTLLRLIAGVLEPEEGRILIDNIPLLQLSPEDISRNMGFKPQDFCLFEGTLEDNIRAGHPPLMPEQRHDILQLSGLVRLFEEGGLHWNTPISSRGMNISGGQRQLVSIARAMLMHPRVLLLDEPTNGLDSTMEAHLAQQLIKMRGKATVLISTHSRPMLEICDRIIVVGQGKLLANGPREKILV